MTERSDNLHQTLAKLHQELEAADDLGEDSRRRLRAAVDEIQAKLKEEGEQDLSTPEEEEDWSDRFRHYAERLQETHPNLVRAIDRVARALSEVGF